MDLGLKNRVAVVTASSAGLGRAVAEALAMEGARLAICSRDEGRINETAAAIRERYGAEVLSAVCDVKDPKDVRGFAESVLSEYGQADILFANAGGPPPGTATRVSPADYEEALRLNLMSTVNLVYAFLPSMRKRRWGRIIASTSISVKQPLPNLALSNVSRVGVVALIKSLSREIAGENITANVVAPGYIMTDRVKSVVGDSADKDGVSFERALGAITAEIPAGRTGRPEEFGALVAFLASEPAAYINGVTVLIDGGLYRGLM